jgi:intraflagellar transport protein 52
MVVLGSVQLLADSYIDKEDNYKLADILLRWLLSEGDVDLSTDAEPDVMEIAPVPDVAAMSEGLKSCLQTSDDIPINFRDMFESSLFKFDTDMIPEAVAIYETMGVKHNQLTLIPP